MSDNRLFALLAAFCTAAAIVFSHVVRRYDSVAHAEDVVAIASSTETGVALESSSSNGVVIDAPLRSRVSWSIATAVGPEMMIPCYEPGRVSVCPMCGKRCDGCRLQLRDENLDTVFDGCLRCLVAAVTTRSR